MAQLRNLRKYEITKIGIDNSDQQMAYLQAEIVSLKKEIISLQSKCEQEEYRYKQVIKERMRHQSQNQAAFHQILLDGNVELIEKKDFDVALELISRGYDGTISANPANELWSYFQSTLLEHGVHLHQNL